jgi:hypothetical protein
VASRIFSKSGRCRSSLSRGCPRLYSALYPGVFVCLTNQGTQPLNSGLPFNSPPFDRLLSPTASHFPLTVPCSHTLFFLPARITNPSAQVFLSLLFSFSRLLLVHSSSPGASNLFRRPPTLPIPHPAPHLLLSTMCGWGAGGATVQWTGARKRRKRAPMIEERGTRSACKMSMDLVQEIYTSDWTCSARREMSTCNDLSGQNMQSVDVSTDAALGPIFGYTMPANLQRTRRRPKNGPDDRTRRRE